MNYSSRTYREGMTVLFLHDGRGMKMVGRLEPCNLDENDKEKVRREAEKGSYYRLSGKCVGYHCLFGRVMGFVINTL